MKLALLIGLNADKRSGWPLTAGLVPFDQALAAFKGMVSARRGLAPHVQLWTSTGVTKSAKFETFAPLVESPSIQPPEIPDDLKKLPKAELVQHLSTAVTRIAELEAHLSALSQPAQQESQEPPFEPAAPEGEELDLPQGESPLVPK